MKDFKKLENLYIRKSKFNKQKIQKILIKKFQKTFFLPSTKIFIENFDHMYIKLTYRRPRRGQNQSFCKINRNY